MIHTPWVLKKNEYSVSVTWNILKMFYRHFVVIDDGVVQLFSTLADFLTLFLPFLIVPLVVEIGVLKSSTIMVDLDISPLVLLVFV